MTETERLRELRAMAESVGLAVPQAATLMMGAADAIDRLDAENRKLRELARLLLWGVDNDMPRYEELAWTQKVNALVRELGIEEEA